MQQINFYRQRVAINVLAKDIANARDIYDAAEGHAAIGVLSAQFASVEEGVQEVKRWMAEIPSISVGLGAGDPAQYYKAAMIASALHPAHVNQADHILLADFHRPGNTVMLRLTRRYPLFFPGDESGGGRVKRFCPAIDNHVRSARRPDA